MDVNVLGGGERSAIGRLCSDAVVAVEQAADIVASRPPRPISVPPYPSQSNPEQSVEATNGGLRSRAPIDSQLLMQRQVLENQSAVSARENDQEPNNVDDPGHHRVSMTGVGSRSRGRVESGFTGVWRSPCRR